MSMSFVDRAWVTHALAPGAGRVSLARTVFPRQETACQRTPGQDPDPLVDAQRDEFVLQFAPEQAVVALQGREPGQMGGVRQAERFHQVPRGELGAAHIPYFPRADQIVQRPERLQHIGAAVVAMHLVQIDVVRPETSQAGLAGAHDVIPGLADGIDVVSHSTVHFGRDQHVVAMPSESLAEYLLREPLRIDVGGIEQADPGVEA